MLNNNIIPKDTVLVNNGPNTKGSALLLRALYGLTRRVGALCIANRRSLRRITVHTRHLNLPASGLGVLSRADVRRVYLVTRRRRPGLVMVSSVRIVRVTSMRSSPNDITRIHRATTCLAHFTGAHNITVIVIKRMAGSNSLTNPGILRRYVSYSILLSNSTSSHFHALHDRGGHFNTIGRLNIFTVARRKLHRIDGPSTVFLDHKSRIASNDSIVII